MMFTSDIIILSCHIVGMVHMASGQSSITKIMGMPSTQSILRICVNLNAPLMFNYSLYIILHMRF
jgi:hypothetical protein